MKGDPLGVRHLTDANEKKEANKIFYSTPESKMIYYSAIDY